MKIDVYYNLHKHCLSVKDRSTGRIAKHADKVLVWNPSFVVQKAGRKKVLEEKRKNVHAFIRGEEDDLSNWKETIDKLHGVKVTYNPYKYSTFVDRETEQPIHGATLALVNGRDVTAYFLDAPEA